MVIKGLRCHEQNQLFLTSTVSHSSSLATRFTIRAFPTMSSNGSSSSAVLDLYAGRPGKNLLGLQFSIEDFPFLNREETSPDEEGANEGCTDVQMVESNQSKSSRLDSTKAIACPDVTSDFNAVPTTTPVSPSSAMSDVSPMNHDHAVVKEHFRAIRRVSELMLNKRCILWVLWSQMKASTPMILKYRVCCHPTASCYRRRYHG